MSQQPLFNRNTYGQDAYLTARYRGVAAEYRLAAELLERGHEVAFPAMGHGYDLVVNARLRVQVKTSKTFMANIGTGKRYGGASKERGVSQYKPFTPDHVDWVACYSRKTCEWWFIPAPILKGLRNLNFGDPLYWQYRNAWDVFEEAKGEENGKTHTEVSALPLRRDQGAEDGGDLRRLRGDQAAESA